MTLPERDRWHLRGLVRRMVEEEVRRALGGLGTRTLQLPSASCQQCATLLDGKRRHAKYCSNRCRVRACRQRRRSVLPAQAA